MIDWITITPLSSSSMHTSVQVTAQRNTSSSARTGSITISGLTSGSTKVVTITQEGFDNTKEPLTFDIISGGTINWKAMSSSNTGFTKTIQYSLNGGEWISITSATAGTEPTISVSAGDRISFRGNNPTYCDGYYYNTFSGSTATFNAYGNIMSLINGLNGRTDRLVSGNTFDYLFRRTNMVDASNLILPATTLTNGCYRSMFYMCSTLIAAPALPAVLMKSACYSQMFSNCSSLTTAPQLTSTHLEESCYNQMFAGCSGLTTAPELPAGTMKSSCYSGMFNGCRSLTSAPVLSATTLADHCYSSMFQGCTSLTSTPELPAATLADGCYQYMFYNCTSLTTAPELPATTLAQKCYQYMFSGCTNLNYIKCLATDISATDCTKNWVSGVAASGAFVKAASMSGWTTGNDGIPSGWTVQNKEEEDYLTFDIISGGTIGLFTVNGDTPKTIQYSLNGGEWTSMVADGQTLSVSAGDTIRMKGNNPCYSNGTSDGTYNTFNGSTASFNIKGNIMSLIYGDNFATASTLESGYTFPNLFRNTNVVDASGMVLPATALTTFCYVSMFRNCTSLTKAPFILPATTLAVRCYSYMFNGCTSLTTAPELPATTLVDNSYRQMFDGCTILNYIKCLATDISANASTYLWVRGVASTGTFVKAASMSGWTTGTNGIPSGWTVQNA